MSVKPIILKVYGLDCVEEISIIKRELADITDENDLSFDLINGKLSIHASKAPFDDDVFIRRIRSAGMRAIPWHVYLKEKDKAQSFWQKHAKLITTLVGSLSLILGFGIHTYLHGPLDALAGGTDAKHIYPQLSKYLYMFSTFVAVAHFIPKAWLSIRRLRADMNLLMLIAVIGAFIIGQWFEAAAVTCLFSIALLLESWSIGRARNAIQSLLSLTPDTADVYCTHDKTFEQKPTQEIKIQSIIRVKPGERIPLDAKVESGASYVNEAPITGESMPVYKHTGQDVYAGSINGDSLLTLRVTKTAEDSTLSRIIQMIEQAQSRRAKTEQWVEGFAAKYTPTMILLAIAIAVIPPLFMGGAWSEWFYEGLVILVIACPCALVISTPVSIVAGLSCAARNGVLVKGGNFLELPARLSTIAFDKTGTLTKGEPEIQAIVPLNQHTPEQLLSVAASLESHSDHPLAQAILRKAKQEKIAFEPAKAFKIIQGKGAMGVIGGREYWLGSHRLLHEVMADKEPDFLHDKALSLEDEGHSIIAIGRNDHICGLISVADELRPESKDTLRSLKEMGVQRLAMLTGDNYGTARAIAQYCDLDEFYAELLPEDKLVKLKAWVETQHSTVAMVGDGINDAPALACADLGIAMGVVGSDAAIETADIALMSDDLSKIAWLVKHSRRVLRIIKQNISLSLLIKACFIILALMGKATLWMAILADMGTSLVVIFNGLRLIRTKF